MSQDIFPLAVWQSGTNENSIPANDNALRVQALMAPAIGVADSEPVEPSEDAQYVIGTPWGGFTSDNVVIYKGGTWIEFEAFEGWVKSIDGELANYSGGAWVPGVGGGGIPDAPSDGSTYGRKDGAWEAVGSGSGLPTGGDSGQVLGKASGADFDVEWVNQTGGGGGGSPSLLLSSIDELGPEESLALPDLPLSGAFTAADLVYVVNSAGNSVKTTLGALKTFINTDPSVVPSSSPWLGATVKRTANLAVVTAVETPIPWQSAVSNTASMWSAGNPTRLTVPNGVTRVRLSGSFQYAANPNGDRFLIISKNGEAFDGRCRNVTRPPNNAASVLGMQGYTSVLDVVPGDYFELRAFQDTGASLDILGSSATWFSMSVVEAQP